MRRSNLVRGPSQYALVVLAALCTSLGPASAAAQARRPYVQVVTENEAVIAWRSAGNEPSRVCFGDAPGTLGSTAGAGTSERDHAVRITGLSPGRTVFYASATTSCPPAAPGPADQHFTTAPPRGGEAPFRAWIVGDSGTGDARQAQVRDAMLAYTATRPIDLFLHLGDMAYNAGTTAEFDSGFFRPYEGILSHVPVWATLGNHEGANADSATGTGPYYEAYVLPTAGEAGGIPSGTEAYYAFDWGNVHFVVLDSHDSPRTPGSAMLRWLEMDLSANDLPWSVVFFHHPPYTHGSHNSDLERQLVDIREYVVPLLDAHAVDLVLAGHSHLYERSYLVRGAYDTPTTSAGHIVDPGDGRIDGDGAYESGLTGSVHVVAGHGGAGVSGAGDHPLMFFSEIANGSCILDVRGALMTLENVRFDGVVTDRVALAHRDGPFLLAPAGGETLLAGSAFDVRWGWAGASPPSNVRLEISLDDGGSFSTLLASTPNDGLERVMLPAAAARAARIRLSPTSAAVPNDVSGAFVLTASGPMVAIPMGATWEYVDDGTDPRPGFLTGAGGPYPAGPAELGYGDGDEATTIQSSPVVPSVYFRRAIPITGRVVRATVEARYDDGIAVFVNGTEVLTRDMDGGLSNDVFASGGGDDNQMVTMDIPVTAFVEGDNWISAIVKQQSAGSSDVSFDLSLTLEVEIDVPMFDGGVGADAGMRADGGPLPDGAIGADGSADAGGTSSGGGCGCRAGAPHGGPLSLLGLLIALLIASRRRADTLRRRA
jgi:MYXO-CTERM domain-containing protein